MALTKKRLLFFPFLALTTFSLDSIANVNQFPSDNPNFLIILADDMGYGELGRYGGVAKTPNLDNLATNGITFTDFYAGAPNCSPSRSALLTGKAPSITGIYNYRPPLHPMHLRSEEKTIAEVLKSQHYQTAIFGKWHLSNLKDNPDLQQPTPIDQGFDYYFTTENNAEPSHHNPQNFIRNGKTAGQIEGYSCQIVANEAILWINNHLNQQNPFFMYVGFHEPHASTQNTAPPDLVENYSQYPGKEANCYANVQNLDSAAGRIIKHLADIDILDNTIIIFASDNGSYRLKANGGLKAVKSYLYEGGIRVPGIFYWKGFHNKGKFINEPAGLIDILPTICDILNIESPDKNNLNGTSILNLLQNNKFIREKPLYWFFYRTSPELAIRLGNHMIMGKDNDMVPRNHQFAAQDMDYIKSLKFTDYELYNLVDDISQSTNIIKSSSKSDKYIETINNQLKHIQKTGFTWENLPALDDKQRKIKTEWVKY